MTNSFQHQKGWCGIELSTFQSPQIWGAALATSCSKRTSGWRSISRSSTATTSNVSSVLVSFAFQFASVFLLKNNFSRLRCEFGQQMGTREARTRSWVTSRTSKNSWMFLLLQAIYEQCGNARSRRIPSRESFFFFLRDLLERFLHSRKSSFAHLNPQAEREFSMWCMRRNFQDSQIYEKTSLIPLRTFECLFLRQMCQRVQEQAAAEISHVGSCRSQVLLSNLQ